MPPAPLPPDEEARLAALRSYQVLDTACEKAFDQLARLAARITDSPVCLVSLVDAGRQWFKARHGLDVTETPRDLAFCAHAILEPEAQLVVPDARQDPRFADNPLVTGEFGLRAYAGTPLVNPEGHALGTLCVLDKTPRAFTPEQLETLRALAEAVQATLELRRAMLQVREMAMTDALTGIANRPAFLDALDAAIARQRRYGHAFGLVYIDLDGFKRTNDTQGHAAGDAVLRGVAEVLRAETRKEEQAARIGGDEMAVLLVVNCGADAAAAAERLRQAINSRMAAGGWPVTASVGAVAFLSPPADVSTAMCMADELMYAAKAAGKNRVVCREHRAHRDAPIPA